MGVVKKKDWWDNSKRIFRRFCRVLFIEGRLMWLFVVVLALAICIPSGLILQSSDQIRISASILQFSAFCIFGIRVCQLHKHYDGEGFWEAIKRWGRRFFPKDAEVNVHTAAGTISVSGEVSGITKNKNLSIEEKVEQLEKDIKKVKDDLKKAQDEISEDLQKLESKLMDEVRDVESQMKKTETKTKELQLKNLGRELVAILWLITAAIINAFPEFL